MTNTPGCILGLDYGTRRVGLALSDASRTIASPSALYERRDASQDARYFRKFVDSENIRLIVVGLPVRTTGREGEKAKEARQFGAWIGEVTGRTVRYWDERFTTADAEEIMLDAGLTEKQRRSRRDMIAAQIMLQSYLNAGCPEEPEIQGLE